PSAGKDRTSLRDDAIHLTGLSCFPSIYTIIRFWEYLKVWMANAFCRTPAWGRRPPGAGPEMQGSIGGQCGSRNGCKVNQEAQHPGVEDFMQRQTEDQGSSQPHREYGALHRRRHPDQIPAPGVVRD